MTFRSAAPLRTEQADSFSLDPQMRGGGHPPALASRHKPRRPCRWPSAVCAFSFDSGLASRWSRSGLSPDAGAGGVA